MTFVVLLCAIRTLKLIDMVANGFCNLARSKALECYRLIVPSVYLEVSYVNQHPIINVEMSSFFYIEGVLFIVDAFENVVDVVVNCCYLVKPFFCGRAGEFEVIMEMYSAWIKVTEASVEREFLCTSGCGIIDKFCKR